MQLSDTAKAKFQKLSKELEEFDKKVVKTRTIMIDGVSAIVKCYPTVKESPEHFWTRQLLRRKG